jgi:hypothetical protein
MAEQPVYQYQCNRCFMVSGFVTRGELAVITCCGGEPMDAIRIEIRNEESWGIKSVKQIGKEPSKG